MGPDIADICRGHLEFMKWADELLLAAVAEHTPEEIAVLQHVFLGEAVWLGRLRGQEHLLLGHLEAPPDAGALRQVWPKLHQDWLDWAASLADWNTVVPHRNAGGEAFRMPAWQIALHVVNHGSFHRGQVAAKLRAAGFAPPATDLILYYRSHAS